MLALSFLNYIVHLIKIFMSSKISFDTSPALTLCLKLHALSFVLLPANHSLAVFHKRRSFSVGLLSILTIPLGMSQTKSLKT